MFFLSAKLLWAVSAPITLLLALMGLGTILLWGRAARLGRALVGTGFGLLCLVGIMPVGGMLLRPLEDRFPPFPETAPAPDGIIVLGGSTDQELAMARGRVTIADAGDRMTEGVVLALRYPKARLVFSGGSAALRGSIDTEAADTRRLWTAMGIPDDRIVLEDRSRDTDENVRFSKRIVAPQPGQRWVLVTSAYHMPRAVALFRANDWPVIPDPVDYRTLGTIADARPSLAIVGNWNRLTLGVHEWIGLIAYRLGGRTKTVLPDP